MPEVVNETEESVKLSPKAKASLGLPEDVVISWVPVPLSKEDNTAINKVARARSTSNNKVKVTDVIYDLLRGPLNDALPAIHTEANAVPEKAPAKPRVAKALPTDEKALAKLEKSLETKAKNLASAMEKAKAALAAAKAKASGTAPSEDAVAE